MNEDRIVGLDTLPTPPPGPGFWTLLHEELVLVQQSRTSTSGVDRIVVRAVREPRRDGARTRWLLAAAVVILLVIGAVAVFAVTRRGTVEPAGHHDGMIDDPRSIDLDPWRRPAAIPPRDVGGPYQLFDLRHLPPGWSVNPASIDGDGYDSIDALAEVDYRWHALVSTSEGQSVSVDVLAPGVGVDPITLMAQRGAPSTVPSSMPTSPQDAVVDPSPGGGIWWLERGVVVVVHWTDEPRVEQATELAAALVPLESDSLGGTLLTPAAEPAEPLFAGTVDGARWWVASSSTSAADGSSDATVVLGSAVAAPETEGDLVTVAVDGVLVSSATTRGAISGDTALDGHGRLYLGRTEQSLASMRVVLSDGVTITLPVVHDDDTTWFAVPVPAGLDVATLDYVDVDGKVLRSRHLPLNPNVDDGAVWDMTDPLG
jgi:hypothetical protein